MPTLSYRECGCGWEHGCAICIFILTSSPIRSFLVSGCEEWAYGGSTTVWRECRTKRVWSTGYGQKEYYLVIFLISGGGSAVGTGSLVARYEPVPPYLSSRNQVKKARRRL